MNKTQNRPSILDQLIAAADRQPTRTLLGSLELLDAKASQDEHERMTYAAISEALIARHGLELAFDEILDDYEDTRTTGEILAALIG